MNSIMKTLRSAKDCEINPGPSVLSFLAALFVTAFVLNWSWEMIQVPAYATMAEFSLFERLRIVTVASFADAAITLGIYGLGALLTRQARWAMKGKRKHYLVFGLLGAAAATIIELRAIASGYWAYADLMPVIPVLGVGLWPFLQLTLLVPAALWIAVWWSRRSYNSAAKER